VLIFLIYQVSTINKKKNSKKKDICSEKRKRKISICKKREGK
jgi:hypothetical protein